MKYESFKKIKLPDKSGVYFFLKGRKILYVGKATSIKDRVKSYFGKSLIETRGPILVDLIFKADKIKWQETDSVLEALILEAVLIKRYQPEYNTKEKSDKSFNYVCITKEKLPRVLIIRERNILEKEKNIKFQAKYGPFTNGSQLKEVMKIIRPIFPYLDDKSKNNYNFYKQLNLVPDLNEKKIYIENIKNLKLFFDGKKKSVVKNLKKGMMICAKNKEFERAGEIKKQLFALQHINDVALIKENIGVAPQNFSPLLSTFRALRRSKWDSQGQKNLKSEARIEAYDIAHMSGKNMVGVMVVVQDGEIEKNEYRKFKIKTQIDANDTGALKEVLERRFKHTEWPFPQFIVVDGGMAQINISKNVLSKLNLNIQIISVLKDERHKPKNIIGNKTIVSKYKKEILLANSEAHRFAITYHKKMRNKNFLI